MEAFFIILMILTSITGLAFIVERGFALRWNRVLPNAIARAAEACRTAADRPMLRQICEQSKAPIARLLIVAEQNLDLPKEENESTLQSRARQEVVRLERGLVVLEIVVGIAPLLGLVGTIYGMMTLFGNMSESGMGDNTKLAVGISIILRFTMAGLLIAIPSLIAWNYYNKKVEMLAVEMESVCAEFLHRQYHAQKKG
jgi:biopolymer transport protein ExbB